MVNGMSTNSTIKSVMPWWQTALYAPDAVLVLLTAACAVAMFRSRKNESAIQIEETKKG